MAAGDERGDMAAGDESGEMALGEIRLETEILGPEHAGWIQHSEVTS